MALIVKNTGTRAVLPSSFQKGWWRVGGASHCVTGGDLRTSELKVLSELSLDYLGIWEA
jgi:hypothetical protein